LVLLAAYAASVVMFYVFARYRYPLVPMLIPFAAAGLIAAPAFLRRLVATLKGSPYDGATSDGAPAATMKGPLHNGSDASRRARPAALNGPRNDRKDASVRVRSAAQTKRPDDRRDNDSDFSRSAALSGPRSIATAAAAVIAVAILSNWPILSADVMRAVT